MKKMEIIARILQKTSALGDTELAGLMGELMSELNSDAEAAAPAPNAASNYVMCVEATLPNGEKVQHPVVGGMCIPRSIEDCKMHVSSNLVELQQENEAYASMMMQCLPVKVRYVPVSDAALKSLEDKLATLLGKLDEAIDKAAEAKAAAYGLMNVDVNEEDISNEMLVDIMQQTLYSGAAINANGDVVERESGVKYAEEEAIEEQRNASDDDEYDDEENYEDEDDDDCCF